MKILVSAQNNIYPIYNHHESDKYVNLIINGRLLSFTLHTLSSKAHYYRKQTCNMNHKIYVHFSWEKDCIVGPNSFNNLQKAGQIWGLFMNPGSSNTCALIRIQSKVILTEILGTNEYLHVYVKTDSVKKIIYTPAGKAKYCKILSSCL